ncbi:MAG: cysteine--tRNA ligase, partial [Candidatus Uhrbacteria bacterium]|nr:cysteine--tRNA ligase [Candidatus Uhrbacteria bacterium]
FDALAFRYYCLGTHYRSKLNFTWEGLEGAQNALNRLRRSFEFYGWGGEDIPLEGKAHSIWKGFVNALENDLNTPEALSYIWEVDRDTTIPLNQRAQLFLEMDKVFGLGFSINVKPEAPVEIISIAEERLLARQNKDWKKSDELRSAIKAKGWIIEDTKDGYELTPEA